MKDIGAKLWQALKELLESIDWKKVGRDLYGKKVEAEWKRLVAKSESKWDDGALLAANFIVEKLLGGGAVKAQADLAAVVAPSDSSPSA